MPTPTIDWSHGKKPWVLVIQGATASGKTGLAVKLAKRFGAEIISADSRQLYREMKIGTAKPSGAEMQSIPHHLIDCLGVDEDFTAGDFEREALRCIGEIVERKRLPIVVGGTGLYMRALLQGLDELPRDQHLRERLQDQYEKHGLESLQKELRKLDPEYFATSDVQNPRRVMRALELLMLSGPGSSMAQLHQKAAPERPFKAIKIATELPREELYSHIDRRVDAMMEAGLMDEVRALLPQRDRPALQCLGYTELFEYLDGTCELQEAVENIKRNSRRYAKRQLTWLRREEGLKAFDPEDLEALCKYISMQMETSR